MRVLVCGGRNYEDREVLHQFMNRLAQRITIDVVIERDAQGLGPALLERRRLHRGGGPCLSTSS